MVKIEKWLLSLNTKIRQMESKLKSEDLKNVVENVTPEEAASLRGSIEWEGKLISIFSKQIEYVEREFERVVEFKILDLEQSLNRLNWKREKVC
ncbi:MAG: hypothetical protein LBI95_03920 [Holosporales bacterium]|jgi:hypothetical protein|nr:hypothetical protein [Holosporales bacterium]